MINARKGTIRDRRLTNTSDADLPANICRLLKTQEITNFGAYQGHCLYTGTEYDDPRPGSIIVADLERPVFGDIIIVAPEDALDGLILNLLEDVRFISPWFTNRLRLLISRGVDLHTCDELVYYAKHGAYTGRISGLSGRRSLPDHTQKLGFLPDYEHATHQLRNDSRLRLTLPNMCFPIKPR